MFEEKDLTQAFGASDEGFRSKFDAALAKAQAGEKPRTGGRLHIKTVVMLLVIIAVLTGSAIAFNQIYLDRADLRASWVLVSAPEDYIEGTGATVHRPLYITDVSADKLPRVDANTAQAIEMLLQGKVFTSDGELTEMLVPIPDSAQYRFTSEHKSFYNSEGEELYEISYVTVGYSQPQDVLLQTMADYEAQLERERQGYSFGDSLTVKLTDNYAEAVELLGADFRLPDAYAKDGGKVEFRYQKSQDRKAVYVAYEGSSSLYYFVEQMRGEDDEPWEWAAINSVIEQCTLKNTVLYKITDSMGLRYTWAHKELVYMLFPDDALTEEQIMKIITSMIR